MGIVKYHESKISEHLHRRASKLKLPLSGTFELTPVCNLNCKMCYIRKSEEERKKLGPLHSAEEWISVAKQAKKNGTLYILLTGGEPFLHPEFEQILAALHEMGMIVSINTNGTLINAHTIEILKKYPPSRINITLYGASNKTYSDLCGVNYVFDKVKENILLLKENGLPVVLNVSVTPFNENDLEQILQFSEDNEIPAKTSAYMFPPLRKQKDKIGVNERFEPEYAAYCTARIERFLTGDDSYVKAVLETDQIVIPVDTAEDCLGEDGAGGEIRCRAGKCSFWVTWQGEMNLCGIIPPLDTSSNVFKNSFEDCWDKTKRISASIRLPKKCDNCKIRNQCRPCAAMAYTETGHFDHVPEYRCRMSHAYPSMSKKLALEILKDNGLSGQDMLSKIEQEKEDI